MQSFSDVIGVFPTLVDYADAIKAKYPTAAAHAQRGNIPPPYWPAVIEAVNKRKGRNALSMDTLARMVRPRKRQRRAA